MSDQPTKSELYAIFVETITAAEQRRNQVAAIYLTVISLTTALLGIYDNLEPLFVVVPVSITSLFWFLNMLYFRSLADAKFAVIGQIEADWPFKPFAVEYEELHKQPAWKRIKLTVIETAFPACIFAAAIAYIGYRVITACPQQALQP